MRRNYFNTVCGAYNAEGIGTSVRGCNKGKYVSYKI